MERSNIVKALYHITHLQVISGGVSVSKRSLKCCFNRMVWDIR